MKRHAGFTLMEMAIVLVIIGLIAGGIMAGRSLIRAAEVQNMVGEYGSYMQAIKEFQDKYHALPGDMGTATSYWSNATNGDGSGTIGSSDTSGTSLTHQSEWWQAWLQLADAGLVQGNFTGTGTGSSAVIGTNVPASKLTGAGWTLNYYLNASGGDMWPDQYGHLFNLGTQKSGDYTKGAVLTPTEALDIDEKLDDGLPGTGKVRAWRTTVLPNCTDETAGTQSGDIYKTTGANSGNYACALVFFAGF